jgi:hypothetical protein
VTPFLFLTRDYTGGMKTLIGVVVAIAIAVFGFVAFSFFGPETANAPKDEVSGGQKVGIADLITVDSPTTGQKISSPVTLTGQARGTWYFEASFPINVLDQNGNTIGQGHAEAQSDWMTADFVPFKATVTFTSPGAGKAGTVRLMKDNPSGLPENDNHVDLPITF